MPYFSNWNDPLSPLRKGQKQRDDSSEKKREESSVEQPKQLKHIQKMAIMGCERLTAQMFSSTDDLFYDLSKRASSNNEANLYFEGMREIRIKREGVTAIFLQELVRGFAQVQRPAERSATSPKPLNTNSANLSIVEGDDLEIDLARSNMISRTEATYTQELYELTARLDHLAPQAAIDEDNNPLAPTAIVDAFIKASQDKLEIDIKALLILFKLFEKHVLKQLGHIYADANQSMINAGILPVVPKFSDRKAQMETPQTSLDDIPLGDEGASSLGQGLEQEPQQDSWSQQSNPQQPAYNQPSNYGSPNSYNTSQQGQPQSSYGQQGYTQNQPQTASIAPTAGQQNYPHDSHAHDSYSHPPFQMQNSSLNALLAAAKNTYTSTAAAIQNATNTLNQAAQGHNGATANYGGQSIPLGQGLNGYVFTANPGPQMPMPELNSLLTEKQPEIDRELSSQAPRNIIAERVNALLAHKNPEEPQALEQDEEDVINLVAMFFDQVLADNDIPVAIQSLLCRLQIPVLRVALQDQYFFENTKHPARNLINAITTVGVNFDESKPAEKDPFYKKIAEIVQRINSEFKTDVAIFSEAEAELQDTFEKEKTKAWAVEQRTKQTEAGKSRMKQARIAAQSTIYKKLKDTELPELVTDFLTRNWLQVMVITHLKHGAGTSEWISADQAITDLIWLCQAHKDSRSQQRKARLQPELMERLEHSLEVAIDNPDIRRTKINQLDTTINSITTKELPKEEFKTITEEHKESLGVGEQDNKPWEEMTAIERQQSRYHKLTTEFYDQAKNISEGTWVSYFIPKQNKHLRCKLSAKMDGDSYIFVNRFGFKSIEKVRKQFAYDLQFGRAKILDNRPIFDRLMTRIVSDLNKPPVLTEAPQS